MCGVITESKEIMVPSVFKKKTTNKQKNADLNAYLKESQKRVSQTENSEKSPILKQKRKIIFTECLSLLSNLSLDSLLFSFCCYYFVAVVF